MTESPKTSLPRVIITGKGLENQYRKFLEGERMKISYRKIKTIRRKPYMVDHYYSLTAEDFFDDDQIREFEFDHIRYVLKGQKVTSNDDFIPCSNSIG